MMRRKLDRPKPVLPGNASPHGQHRLVPSTTAQVKCLPLLLSVLLIFFVAMSRDIDTRLDMAQAPVIKQDGMEERNQATFASPVAEAAIGGETVPLPNNQTSKMAAPRGRDNYCSTSSQNNTEMQSYLSDNLVIKTMGMKEAETGQSCSFAGSQGLQVQVNEG
ncbi:uncharacterized protein [Amphiura filiformis]|uniref:uncharacterized protein n=1 Tax=Amphiura filiformis TaxID=82378 RepID=UPI003B217E29